MAVMISESVVRDLSHGLRLLAIPDLPCWRWWRGCWLLFTWMLLKEAAVAAANLTSVEYGGLVFDVAPDLALFAYCAPYRPGSQLTGCLISRGGSVCRLMAGMISGLA